MQGECAFTVTLKPAARHCLPSVFHEYQRAVKIASAVVLSILLVQPALAATRHWTGTKSGLWSDASNWGGIAPLPGDDLVFDSSNYSSMTNDYPSGTDFNSLTFSSGSCSLQGNMMALGPGGWTQHNAITVFATIPISLTASQTWQLPDFGPIGGLWLGQPSDVSTLDLGSNTLTITGVGPNGLCSVISGTGGITLLNGSVGITNGARLNYTGPTTIGANAGLTFYTPDSGPVMTPIVVNDGGGFGVNTSSVDLNASLTLNPGSTFHATLNPPSAGQYSLTVRNGVITLGGNLDAGWTLKPAGTVFTLIHNETGNPISGTFKGLPEGATFKPYDGYNAYRISYLGGGGHDVTLTVVATPTVTTLATSCASSKSGENVTFTATVSPAATGSVTFFDCGVPVATVPLDGSSRASLTTGSLACGSHNITAQYLGSSMLAGSTSPVVVQQVLINTAIPALDPRILAVLGALLAAIAVVQYRR